MDLKKIKKKEKKEKTPSVKKITQKKANRFVLAGLVVLFIFSVIGVIRANAVASNFTRLNAEVKTISQQSTKKEVVKKEFDESALSFYAQNFVKEYINYNTKWEDDVKKARLDRLSKYLSFDVKNVDETENHTKDFVRKFKEADVIQVEETDTSKLIHLNIVYELEQSKKTRTIQEEIVLPIQAKDDLFAIVSRPYFLATTLPQGKTEPLEAVKEQVDVPVKEKQAIQKFLKMFFEKYANGKKEELMLLMKEPEKANGADKFVSFDTNEIKYFEVKEEGVHGVQVSVTFENIETNLKHTEDFSLWISKTENSYFVNTFKHYFTEKAGN